jgi:hypothetical protein
MKSTILALALTVISMILWPSTSAVAQEEKVARGTITAIGGGSLSMQVAGTVMNFSVDRQTRVDAPGASTKARQANAAGKAGPHLGDVLKVGQSVAVTYRDAGGPLRASLVRAIPSAGRAGGSVKTVSEMHSVGTVKAVFADSITISGNGGGASFTQTFKIGPDTTVVGKGAGTAAAARGGRVPLSNLIAAGDRVSVAYWTDGADLRASDVRVTLKRSGSHKGSGAH